MIEAFRVTDYTLAIGPMKETWEMFAEDGAELKIPDIVNEYWIGIRDNDQYAGVVRFAQVTAVMFECHICIRKQYRNVVAYAKKALEWIVNNVPEAMRLVCNVPEFKRGAIKVAKELGFKMQGFNSGAYLKNGKLHGLVNLGIDRETMEGICRQQFPY